MKKVLNIATIFSGIGAPEQALKRMNIDSNLIFACDNCERLIDIDYKMEFEKVKLLPNPKEKMNYVNSLYNEKTRKTNFVETSFKANYQPEYFFQDVKLLDGRDFYGKIDLFVGGSPCQSFSIAGKQGGFEDIRGTLFYEYCRLVKEIQPKVFIYENVSNVLKHNKGLTWKIMSNIFTELDYYWDFKVLNAKDYGIPQSRNRLFVVGFKNKDNFNKFNFPEPIKLSTTMQDYLEDNCSMGSLLSVNGVLTKINNEHGKPDNCYFLSEKVAKYVLSPGTKNFFHPDAKTDLPIARALLSTMNNCHRASVDNYITYEDQKIRKLTEREALRLMGFPDDFNIAVSKAQTYKQAGNSIVVDVIIALYKQIIKSEAFDGKSK